MLILDQTGNELFQASFERALEVARKAGANVCFQRDGQPVVVSPYSEWSIVHSQHQDRLKRQRCLVVTSLIRDTGERDMDYLARALALSRAGEVAVELQDDKFIALHAVYPWTPREYAIWKNRGKG